MAKEHKHNNHGHQAEHGKNAHHGKAAHEKNAAHGKHAKPETLNKEHEQADYKNKSNWSKK